jgi:tRNA (cytosine38-C5)-methyltransferase
MMMMMPTNNNRDPNDITTSVAIFSSTTTMTKAVPPKTITYIEFYSGVGGWTMALQEAVRRLSSGSGGVECHHNNNNISTTTSTNKTPTHPIYTLKRLAALDHSDLCNRVFEYNFGPRSSSNVSTTTAIEQLTLCQMEDWAANVWVMSPPCQPHTRQHDNQQHDLSDPRSFSFLHLCQLLETMKSQSLPQLIFLENVVGFETSHSFQQWCHVLKKREYCGGHFHLTPTQVGLPNDRPRYYCIAAKQQQQQQHVTPLVLSTTDSISDDKNLSRYMSDCSTQEVASTDPNALLSKPSLPIWKAIPELGVVESTSKDLLIQPIASFLDDTSSESCHSVTNNKTPSLQVPTKILQKTSAWCFDIVSPNDRRSACFTHSYGRYIRGTGSILYEISEDDVHNHGGGAILPKLVAPEERVFQVDWMKDLDPSKLRYFSGQELTRLFGFSRTFSFPPDMTMKQQWKLMGNSLNVQVASRLVELGFKVGDLAGGPSR